MLPDGKFMLGSCCASPAVQALFDPTTLAWTATGAPTATCQHAAAVKGGDVFYARTFDFSTMSIAPAKSGFTKFTVASDTTLGAAELHVVTNGLRSSGHAVTISNACG